MFAVLWNSCDGPIQLRGREWVLPPGTRKIAEYSRDACGEVVLVEVTGDRGAALRQVERNGMITAWAANIENGFDLARSVIERRPHITGACRRRSENR